MISSFLTVALSPFVPQTETFQMRMQACVSQPLISSQAELALPSFLSQVEIFSTTMHTAGGPDLAFSSFLSQVEIVSTSIHVSGGSGVCRRSHRPQEMKGLLAQLLLLYPFLSVRLER